MSVQVVKSKIHKFLSSDTPEVLAISGAWGIGKTYSWNKFLLDEKEAVALTRYSYVSLFGINSLESLRYSIFEKMISKDLIGNNPNIESFKNNSGRLLEKLGRKTFGLVKDSSFIEGFKPALESLSFFSVNSAIICIDDLERRGSDLAIKDVLGLVSQLKEQKNCKVVLLLNDGEEGLDDYHKYREKVVDVDLHFSPTALESAEIAFGDENSLKESVSKLTQKLNIRNIRILKKIERTISGALPLTTSYHPMLVDTIKSSLVLFCWCHYCSGDEVPRLDQIKNFILDEYLLENEDKKDGREAKWRKVISDYGYLYTDELDLVLIEAVISGYVDEENFKTKADLKNREYTESNVNQLYGVIWALFRGGFDDNEEDICQMMKDFIYQNVSFIDPIKLNTIVHMLKELDKSESASELIDFYIDSRSHEKDIFDLERFEFFKSPINEEIIEKFKKQFIPSITKESLDDVLNRIILRGGANPKEIAILADVSKEDFYTLFKETKGDDLAAYIRECLKYGEYVNGDDSHKIIANNAREALKRIGRESNLNKIRVSRYGIKLDE